MLSQYELKDTYNADELGLLYRSVLKKILHVKLTNIMVVKKAKSGFE